MTNLFTSPGRVERRGDTHPLFGRLTITRGVSLLKTAGVYRQVEGPSDEDIVAADIAYLGGHVYLVSDPEALSLTDAGYGEWVTNPDVVPGGYGSGLFGVGVYDAIEVPNSPLYGGDPYGSGNFGE